MIEKRFTLSIDTEWWFVDDNTIKVNEYGYRDDLTGNDKYRGLKKTLTEQEVVDLLNTLNDENKQFKRECMKLAMIKGVMEEFHTNDNTTSIDVCNCIESILSL